ncbi:MAG: hypothetical protein AAFN27_18735 [Pseudomonadota bacterium]
MKEHNDPYRLIRYVGLGATEGIIAGWVILLIMKHLDIAQIGTLIANSQHGALAFFMMLFFFGITFGMVGLAWRIMVLLPDDED